jgi:hypothetical protein
LKGGEQVAGDLGVGVDGVVGDDGVFPDVNTLF